MINYLHVYLLIGIASGMSIFLIECITPCMRLTILKRCIHVLVGIVFWLPLTILFAFVSLFAFLSWIERMKVERNKLITFNKEHKIGDVVHFTRDNFEEKDSPVLSEAKMVKLYYGYRACIKYNVVPDYAVWVDLKHIT